MLRHCMDSWWERVGSTPVSGITKLMMSEGRNFPELAEFYRRSVIEPGHALLRRILRRGVERGEFAPMDVDHAIYLVLAPMLFLMLWRHAANTCVDAGAAFDPLKYIALQTETVLHGLCVPPARAPA